MPRMKTLDTLANARCSFCTRSALSGAPRRNSAQALTLHLTSIPNDRQEYAAMTRFLQRFVDRKVLGDLRYGAISAGKQYGKRLALEYTRYEATGNAEHLLNIAVYAFLETYAPSHPNFHFDNTAPSATRHILKGNIA